MPKTTLEQARKEWFAIAADPRSTFEAFTRGYRKVVRIREAAIKKANAKTLRGA